MQSPELSLPPPKARTSRKLGSGARMEREPRPSAVEYRHFHHKAPCRVPAGFLDSIKLRTKKARGRDVMNTH